MKTIALDTNVLLSFRLKRLPHFSEAERLIKECLDKKFYLYISSAVFLEVEWVLRSYYKQTKSEIVTFFQEILALDNLISKDRKILESAVTLYDQHNISFTDSVVLAEILDQGVDDFNSFDEDLDKLYSQEKN